MAIRRRLLSDLFTGVVTKKLTLVETITPRSNRHGFQGTRPFRKLFGDEEQDNIPTRFIILTDDKDDFFIDGFLSWINESKNKLGPPKYHLYYSGNDLTEAMRIGERMFLVRQIDGIFLVVIVPDASTINAQLRWLFGFSDENGNDSQFRAFSNNNSPKLDFAARYILNKLYIDF
jgi:hypothetical protein